MAATKVLLVGGAGLLACLALLVSLSSRGGGPTALEYKPPWEQTPKHFNRYRFSRQGGARQQQLLQEAPAARGQAAKRVFGTPTNQVWSGANGGGYGYARKPVSRRAGAPMMQGLRYSTEVPHPEENSLGQPYNNPNSYMGTNVVWSGANGGGYGFARRPLGPRLAVKRAQALYGTETYPYWEEENTGNAQAFADEYIANCVQKLNPSVGCEGAWDSKVWGTPRDTYDDSHPELDIWPP